MIWRARKNLTIYKKFCRDIDTTLRLLEEGTLWANKDELYINLIKKADRKYMKEYDCTITFWDYRFERRKSINNITAKIYLN